MAGSRKLSIEIVGDAKGVGKAFKEAEQGATVLGNSVDKTSATLTKVGGVALGAAALVGVGFLKAGDAASDLGESINAVNVTFGDAAAGVLALGETAATSVGLSNAEFNGLAVQFSSFATTIAGAGGDVTGTLDDMTTRAADFASVMNIDVADAASIFQSGLAGETEPLKKFGIDLSAAAVGAYAVAEGISESASSMSEAEKVQARYGLLMEATSKTQGDFANTADSAANAQRIASAEMENAMASLGEIVTPIMAKAASAVSTLATGFTSLNESTDGAIGKFVAIAAVGVGALGALSLITGQALKLKAAIGPDGNLGKLVAGLKKVDPAVTATAGVIGAATLVYTLYSQGKEEAAQRTADLSEALREEGSAQSEAVASLALADSKVKEYVEGLDLLGLSLKDVNQFTAEGTGPVADLVATWEKYKGLDIVVQEQRLREELQLGTEVTFGQVIAIIKFAEQTDELKKAQDEQADTLSTVNRLSGDYTAAVHGAGEAARDGTQPVTDYTAAVHGAGEAARESATKTDAFELAIKNADAAYSALMGKLNEEIAWDNAQKAIDGYIWKANDGVTSTDALRQEFLDIAPDLATFVQGLEDVPAETKTDLYAALDSGNIDLFNTLLDGVPASKTVQLKFAIDSASKAAALASIPGGLSASGYAAGTNSAPPGWAWTGEDGPELVKFRGGETVKTAAQSKVMAAAAHSQPSAFYSTSGTTIVQVNVGGSLISESDMIRKVGDGLVDAVKRGVIPPGAFG